MYILVARMVKNKFTFLGPHTFGLRDVRKSLDFCYLFIPLLLRQRGHLIADDADFLVLLHLNVYCSLKYAQFFKLQFGMA